MIDPFSGMSPGDVPAAMGVLAKIASGETTSDPLGGYDELYDGGKFNSYDAHPNVHLPIGNGQFTSAAGKYQFENSTWNNEAKKLGLSDFSPQSQDMAAWDLANTTYEKQTGRSLLSDAKSNQVDWGALSGEWPSLGSKSGGIEGGQQAEQATASGAATAPAQRSPNISLLTALAPHLTFTPIDYDPFKVEQS